MRPEMEEAPGSPIRGRERAYATDTTQWSAPTLAALDDQLEDFMVQQQIHSPRLPPWYNTWDGRALNAVRLASLYGGGNLVRAFVEAVIVGVSMSLYILD